MSESEIPLFTQFAVVDEDTSTVYGIGETPEKARHVASVRGGAYFRDPADRERTIGYLPAGPIVRPCTERFAQYCLTLSSYTSPPSYATVVLNWSKVEQGIGLTDEFSSDISK
jgi:hypothetical protein